MLAFAPNPQGVDESGSACEIIVLFVVLSGNVTVVVVHFTDIGAANPDIVIVSPVEPVFPIPVHEMTCRPNVSL